jgi:nucleoside-diphosphate-sugar epimerase
MLHAAQEAPVAVLGSRSFIGARLMARLVGAGKPATGYSSDDCDLTDAQAVAGLVASFQPGTRVAFLATVNRQRDNSFEALEKNLHMAENLGQAAARAKLDGVVFFSSADVYGPAPALPITEATPPGPAHHYGVGKLACEHLLRVLLPQDCPLTVLRPPGVYGPGDSGRSVVGGFAARMRAGLPVSLYGSGKVLRDYVHVDDACAVAEAFLEKPLSGTFNLATGISLSIREIAHITAEALGLPLAAEVVLAVDPGHDLVFNTAALRRALPDVAFRNLFTGVRSYLEEPRA